jgi:hypothetical protein
MIVPGSKRIERAARAFDQVGKDGPQALRAEYELFGREFAVGGAGSVPTTWKLSVISQ